MLFDYPEEDSDDFFADADEAPVAAAPELPKTPRTQTTLLGHEEIEKHLLGLIASERFPSTLILNGTVGIGKATTAYRLARYLFKYKNNEDDGPSLFGAPEPPPSDSLAVPSGDTVFQQVASGGYPDLLSIERVVDDKGKIKNHDIDEVRATTQFFRRTSSQGGWRVAIIDDADTMNWHAQNALLKILEEPPKKALLILISHRIGALLPTILSRAQVINFQALSDETIRQIVKTDISRYEPVTQSRIISMAGGSVSRAQMYADTECCLTMEQTVSLLSAWPNLDWTAIQHFADAIGGKGTGDAGQAAFRDTMMWMAYGLARAKSLGHGHELGAILNGHTQAQLLKLCDDLKQHFDQVQISSLDKRFMVIGAYALIAGRS